jgi:hypothetical protein
MRVNARDLAYDAERYLPFATPATRATFAGTQIVDVFERLDAKTLQSVKTKVDQALDADSPDVANQLDLAIKAPVLGGLSVGAAVSGLVGIICMFPIVDAAIAVGAATPVGLIVVAIIAFLALIAFIVAAAMVSRSPEHMDRATADKAAGVALDEAAKLCQCPPHGNDGRSIGESPAPAR